MSRRRKKIAKTATTPTPSPARKHLPRWKLWLFRVSALVLVPLLFFSLLELTLRLAGFGYSTDFLLPGELNGKKCWIQNDRFGWPFFSRHFSREPRALAISQEKPPGSIRVFVFGESAAFGDPQPDFGLPRMLQALLELRHPGARFDVVNAAMTGINSHAVRAIARDCAKADGDIWVVYMGNNEVVGPFGAGTVFGPQVPPLWLIRSSLAAKSTRIGQLLDAARERFQPPPPARSEWGGMLMFLDQQVRANDPRMERVYHHFEDNLSDIIAAGQRAGAGIVVSTVAVNLKDCAPFASKHREGLSADEEARFENLYERGIQLQTEEKLTEALAVFDEAARLDDTVAELQFRRARCVLGLGDAGKSKEIFERARDLDSLRFRCDSRLNEITRRLATEVRQLDNRVLLADAESALATHSKQNIPGSEFFYEHVHLTWEGNWLLAGTIAQQVERLLRESVVKAPPDAPRPSPADCAARLAWTDTSRAEAVSDMIGRLHDPPFTFQINHEEQMARLGEQLQQLISAFQPAGISNAARRCEAAVSESPDDATLQALLSRFKQRMGDTQGALEAARRCLELMPHVAAGWSRLGSLLAQSGENGEAIDAFESGLQLDPDNFWMMHSLASAYKSAGRTNEALRELRRAVAIKPRFGIAYLSIGEILEQRGQKAEAEELYQKALQNRIYRTAELAVLARFCASKGWFAQAVTNYQDALKLSPADSSLHLELARALTELDRKDEAGLHLAAATRLDPSQLEARFRLGLELGRAGKPAEAAEQFREIVRLSPDLVEARLNLGIALVNQNLALEALAEFQEVLRRSPTNPLALRYVESLKEKLGANVPADLPE